MRTDQLIDGYPTLPGTYLAIKEGTVVLCLFIGWFPAIELKSITNVTKFFISIEENSSKKLTEKELMNSIRYDRDLWKFYSLDFKNISLRDYADIKDFTRMKDIDDDEYYTLYKIYCRIKLSGASWIKMIDVIRVRTNLDREAALSLIRQFDEKMYSNRV